MMEKQMTVLRIAPHRAPEIVMLHDELAALQEAVSDGHPNSLIEFVWMDDGVSLMVNEEGKLIGLEPNRRLGGNILVGTFYVVADGADGELASLTEEQIQKYSAMFADPDEDISPEEVENTMQVLFFSD